MSVSKCIFFLLSQDGLNLSPGMKCQPVDQRTFTLGKFTLFCISVPSILIRKFRPPTINGVYKQGMANAGQVHPDLMHSACVQGNLHFRKPFITMKGAISGQRGFPFYKPSWFRAAFQTARVHQCFLHRANCHLPVPDKLCWCPDFQKQGLIICASLHLLQKQPTNWCLCPGGEW